MDMQDLVALAGKQRVFRAREKIQAAGYISHITQSNLPPFFGPFSMRGIPPRSGVRQWSGGGRA